MSFQGYNGWTRVQGDELVVDRSGGRGRVGAPTEQRFALEDVQGASPTPSPQTRSAGDLKLVVARPPDVELPRSKAMDAPRVVAVTGRQQPDVELLHARLKQGGDLELPSSAAARPAASSASPAPAAPAPVALTASVTPAPAPGLDDPFGAPARPVTGAAPAWGAMASGPPPGPRTMPQAVLVVLGNDARFAGRAGRAEYGWWTLAVALACVIAAPIVAVTGSAVLGAVVGLGGLVPPVGSSGRRLHETDRSGGWYGIALVAPVAWLVLPVFLAATGGTEQNGHGPAPW